MILANVFSLRDDLLWILGLLQDLLLGIVHAIQAMGGLVISGVFALLGALFPSVDWSAYSAYLAKIDSIFPLRELVTYSLVLLGAYLWVVAYKAVKSWIPTVSGGG